MIDDVMVHYWGGYINMALLELKTNGQQIIFSTEVKWLTSMEFFPNSQPLLHGVPQRSKLVVFAIF